MNNADFASLIAGLKGAGQSKADVARQTGLSRATLYRVLNNENRNHFADTYARVERLAKRYGVNGASVPRGRLFDR